MLEGPGRDGGVVLTFKNRNLVTNLGLVCASSVVTCNKHVVHHCCNT